MFTANFIRRHIFRLPRGRIFTTRELLSYGQRATVDKVLGRLVKKEIIVRLARGVFVRLDPGEPFPCAFEVARAKAHAFGKRIARHCADIAKELGLVADGPAEPTFAVSGRSSSFRYGHQVIHLKGTCLRKMRIKESNAGLVIRALWHRGRAACSYEAVRKATEIAWRRQDREELRQSKAWMPAWMGRYFPTLRYCDMTLDNRWRSLLCSEPTPSYLATG